MAAVWLLIEFSCLKVMKSLLECYAKAGKRKLVRAKGSLVSVDILDALLVELRDWALKSGTNNRRHMTQQERPSIAAESYMILSRYPITSSARCTAGCYRSVAKDRMVC